MFGFLSTNMKNMREISATYIVRNNVIISIFFCFYKTYKKVKNYVVFDMRPIKQNFLKIYIFDKLNLEIEYSRMYVIEIDYL